MQREKIFNKYSIVWLIFNFPTPFFGASLIELLVVELFDADYRVFIVSFFLVIIGLIIALSYGYEIKENGERKYYKVPLVISVVLIVITGIKILLSQ